MTIRYFINNKDSNEYLISGDNDKIVIIWDITNNYEIKYKIKTNYGKRNFIFSCLIIFPHNSNNNYDILLFHQVILQKIWKNLLQKYIL